ncbi:MAG TPA: hypothetical protein VGD14_25610 [bacterium]
MLQLNKYFSILVSKIFWLQLKQVIALFFSHNVWSIMKLGAVGSNFVIRPTASLAYSENIFLGNNVHINRNSDIVISIGRILWIK